MNYFEGVAKLLGLELEEEFKVKAYDNTYKLTTEGLKRKINDSGSFIKSGIELNYLTPESIIKLPWRPKKGDKYYSLDITSEDAIDWFIYKDDNLDEMIFERGLGFKTEKEAIDTFNEIQRFLKEGK